MIQFDIMFGREAVRIEAACFGWLSSANDFDYRLGKIQDDEQRDFARDFTSGAARPTELVWYPGNSAIPGDGVEDAWPIVEEVVASWPWLDDVVMLRKATQTVHVKLGDTACDKSILCMGIIRNFFMIKSFRDAYKKAKERGASPREAYIFCSLLEYISDWRDNWTICTRELWEYDNVNSATFGRKALAVMCQPDYAPWQQQNWNEQVGYDRDHTMRGAFVGFNGQRRGNKLLNVFSIEDDEPILHRQLEVRVQDNDGVDNIVNVIRQAFNA